MRVIRNGTYLCQMIYAADTIYYRRGATDVTPHFPYKWLKYANNADLFSNKVKLYKPSFPINSGGVQIYALGKLRVAFINISVPAGTADGFSIIASLSGDETPLPTYQFVNVVQSVNKLIPIQIMSDGLHIQSGTKYDGGWMRGQVVYFVI